MSLKARITSPAFFTTLFLLIFAVIVFRAVWPADQVIQSQDFNYGLMGQYKTELPGSFFDGFWRGAPLLGRAGHTAPTWTQLSLTVLPLDLYMDWMYAINLLLASGFLIAFLRLRGLAWLPSTAGAITAFWLGSNLTLILPGHLEKYAVLVFASATLYGLEQTLQKASFRWSLLAGASLGWMFMHQADLALFFGMVLGAYWLFGVITRMKVSRTKRLALHVPMLIAALLFSWESYNYAMRTQVNHVEILEKGSPEDKWNFATQWSFPPEESLDLIAPGFWGWMSQHEHAPYHGRMGQSPEWAESLQGFPNFKSESVYLGILPFFFMILALVRFRKRKAETQFWVLALVITFLLACGKYTPLYELFFKLPLVNSIRNPNKFLQVFQWILGILCAFGLQQLLSPDLPGTLRKRVGMCLILISLVAGASSLLTQPGNETQLAAFAESPWVGQAKGLLQNRQLSLLHLSLLSAAGGGLIFLSVSQKSRKVVLPSLLILMSVDAVLLSRMYLLPAHTRFIKVNKVASFLKANLGEQRVTVIDSRGLYNLYLTHLFPYHHIAFTNITAAPRLATDYQEYLRKTQSDPIRHWQEFAVKYALAPRNIAESILRNPGIDQVLQEVYSYDLAEHPEGGLQIVPGKVGVSGQHVILEFSLPNQRFSLLPLNSTDSDSAFRNNQRNGEIQQVLQNSSGFLIQTDVKKGGALLRLSDYFDPRLRVRIDGGSPQPLIRTGALFAGVELPEGQHQIEFFPAAPGIGIYAQWAGLLLALGTAFSFLIFPGKKPLEALHE